MQSCIDPPTIMFDYVNKLKTRHNKVKKQSRMASLLKGAKWYPWVNGEGLDQGISQRLPCKVILGGSKARNNYAAQEKQQRKQKGFSPSSHFHLRLTTKTFLLDLPALFPLGISLAQPSFPG